MSDKVVAGGVDESLVMYQGHYVSILRWLVISEKREWARQKRRNSW